MTEETILSRKKMKKFIGKIQKADTLLALDELHVKTQIAMNQHGFGDLGGKTLEGFAWGRLNQMIEDKAELIINNMSAHWHNEWDDSKSPNEPEGQDKPEEGV